MCMHADKDSPPPPKRSHAKASKGAKLPRPTDPISCPRCCSEDTKFCYYNNYNSKQPRYFCKVRVEPMLQASHHQLSVLPAASQVTHGKEWSSSVRGLEAGGRSWCIRSVGCSWYQLSCLLEAQVHSLGLLAMLASPTACCNGWTEQHALLSASLPSVLLQACQRYWTEGGTLRNVPVGAGRRKNKGRDCKESSDDGLSRGGSGKAETIASGLRQGSSPSAPYEPQCTAQEPSATAAGFSTGGMCAGTAGLGFMPGVISGAEGLAGYGAGGYGTVQTGKG